MYCSHLFTRNCRPFCAQLARTVTTKRITYLTYAINPPVTVVMDCVFVADLCSVCHCLYSWQWNHCAEQRRACVEFIEQRCSTVHWEWLVIGLAYLCVKTQTDRFNWHPMTTEKLNSAHGHKNSVDNPHKKPFPSSPDKNSYRVDVNWTVKAWLHTKQNYFSRWAPECTNVGY